MRAKSEAACNSCMACVSDGVKDENLLPISKVDRRDRATLGVMRYYHVPPNCTFQAKLRDQNFPAKMEILPSYIVCPPSLGLRCTV